MALTASYTFHGLTIELHEDKTATPAAHPAITMSVATGLPILGGGAAVNHGNGPGSLLTASVPANPSGSPAGPYLWTARGKDHLVPDPSTISAWGLALVSCRPD